jgi:tRNA uridine 5-carboxymethylaminomethyl modification enzyme
VPSQCLCGESGLAPVVLRRDQAYIGVMMDDLITKTPREPYRMFTSRAEHRLLLRADNADLRLTPLAREWGLVHDSSPRWQRFTRTRDAIEAILHIMRTTRAPVSDNGRTVADLARRPDVTVDEIAAMVAGARITHHATHPLVGRAIIELQYEGYIIRQHAEIRRRSESENQRLPADLDYTAIPGLRAEAAEHLARFRPATMGQASRLAGVNPADLTLLAVAIKRRAMAAAQRPQQPAGAA